MYEFLYSPSYVDIKSFLKEVRSDVFKVIFLVIFFVIFIRIMMKINKNVIGTKKNDFAIHLKLNQYMRIFEIYRKLRFTMFT